MSINAPTTCPQCGAPLREDAAGGLCPRCVMALNLKPETVFTGELAAASAPRTPAELAPHFPQLEILECLGRGGMGVVYKARQPQLDRVVALKILAPERVTEARFADRFLREARALAKLNHPNIVAVHDFGQTGGYFYLVMEFVDGVNLRELLRGGRLPPAEALAIVPAICDALQYAHDRGIVHRDIKPENILIDKEGKVKIADFGIAKMIEPGAGGTEVTEGTEGTAIGAARRHGPTGVVGTPKYMAPEQAEKPGAVDHRADIYSLGVVFYEMLTGELPGKLLEAPSKKVQIDVRLDEVVLRALERKPELRFQQASVLKTQLETIAQTGETGGGMTDAQREEYGEKAPTAPKPISEKTRSKRERYLALSPLLSPESKEIALHMTEAEWKTMMRWGWFFAFWNAAICFLPVFILFFAPSPWGDWRLALAVVLVGLAAYPAWYKMLWHLRCDTEWARAHGIKPIPILKYFSKASFARFPKRRPIPQRIPLLILLASLVVVPLMCFVTAQMLIWHVTNKYSKPNKAAASTGAPFVGHFSNGTVELLLVGADPALSTLCWQPDGTLSYEPFPNTNGHVWSQGMEMRTIAFRVHGTTAQPVLKFNPELKFQGSYTTSMGWPDPKSPDAIFTEQFTCPSNSLKMNVHVGVANGPWEEKITLLSPGGNSEWVEPDGTSWRASVQTNGSAGSEVVIAYLQSLCEGWETRFVAVDTNGEPIMLPPGTQTSIGTNLTSVLTSLRREKFDQIKQYQLQGRKRQWVEFRSVSLEPGYHTKVEIFDAPPQKNDEF